MKKTVLTLGLLSIVGGAFAQTPSAGPWVEVNTSNIQTPNSYLFDQIHTLSPTVMWGIPSASTAGSTNTTIVRASNAAGTEFDFNSVQGTGTYQVANVHGINAQMAYVAQFGGSGGGEILRTPDGGVTWRPQTTAAQFAAPAGFANWVYMFDNDNGVSLGDPNPLPATGPGEFEILVKRNGGAWTRVSGSLPVPLDEEEYGLVRSYFGLGNTIWAGTSHNIGGSIPAPVRVLKSVDRGDTWTVANTPLQGAVSRLAFKDQNVGIATTRSTAGGVELIRTIDGGTTWSSVNFTPADTLTGKFYGYDIDAIPGVGFISVGSAVVSGPRRFDFGVSFSPDGRNWYDIEKGGRSYTAVDLINCAPGSALGYLAGFTNATTGAGGIYKLACTAMPNAILTAKRSAEMQKALSVYPNPSTSGVFNVGFADGIKSTTALLVVDALGRQVYSTTLFTNQANAKGINLDLSKEKPGVYTLKLTSATGTATQKLVIQ